MDFYIGALEEKVEDWLKREGMFSPFNLKIDWEKNVPADFLPVVVIQNAISPMGLIAHSKKVLDSLTSMGDERRRTIYFVKIEKLLEVAGQDFINYAKSNNLASKELLTEVEKKEKEKLAKSRELLFEGDPNLLGGLSNEVALTRACPAQFKESNPWSDYAMSLFYSGGNIKNWKWKESDPQIRARQFSRFRALLGTFGIPHEDKEAVAGWMLSEILESVPECIPVE